MWFRELIQGPLGTITVSPMYFTRGYVFHTFEHGKRRATTNYGISVRGDSDFYGVLTEIIEVGYPGVLNLKCTLFKCEWYDPVIGRGVRLNKHGVIDVNSSRRYQKFEPFILGSQAEQVTFLPYPRVKDTGITWLSVIRVVPRGIVLGEDAEVAAMQEIASSEIDVAEQTSNEILLINPHNREVEDIGSTDHEENTEGDEFHENSSNEDENDSENE